MVAGIIMQSLVGIGSWLYNKRETRPGSDVHVHVKTYYNNNNNNNTPRTNESTLFYTQGVARKWSRKQCNYI